MLDFPRWKILSITGVCLVFVLFSIPSLLPTHIREKLPSWMPNQAVSLGLDLRGGSQLLLEIDFDTFYNEQLNTLLDETRVKLREKKLGYRGLAVKNNKVHFTLRNTSEEDLTQEDLKAVLHGISADLDIEQSGQDFAIKYNNKWQQSARELVINQSREIVDRRVNETGTKEPIIQRQGDMRILLQVPGLNDPEHLKRLLGRTAKLTFHMVDTTVDEADLQRNFSPPGTRIVSGSDDDADRYNGGSPRKYAIFSRVDISGDMLIDAKPSYDERSGEPVVSFTLNHTGARRFGEVTSKNVGKPFAVILDNRVITAPVIRSAILGGSGYISGSFTTESANDLALLLRAGALPAPLKIIEERSVGPSLGADSIAAGTQASIIAIAMVVVFMIVFYGLFGLFADIAMVINALMTLALLSMFEATLTLPGIAGIVLTVGMAVDANVLIYERMREEVRNGSNPIKAVENGFRLAFGTIFDSHLTTLVASLILYQFGTGSVKGFAVTLAIGIVCSLFTAVLVTRMMVVTWLHKKRPKQLPI